VPDKIAQATGRKAIFIVVAMVDANPAVTSYPLYRKKVPKVDALWATFDIRKAVHIARAKDRDEGKVDL